MLSTPGGKPASWKIFASAITALGASSGPFRMSVQPAPIAATILRIAWLNGKFHGVKATHTPTGWRTTSWRTFGARDGITRP